MTSLIHLSNEWNCYRNLKLRWGTLRQFSRKQCFIVLAQTQWTHVQRLSPENKGVPPSIPLQVDYRNKKQSSSHIWLHVTSLAISFPQCTVTFFMFQLFKFSFSTLPSLSPASLSEHSLFFFWSSSLLQYSPLGCSDPRGVKEHHLDLGVCIFIASLHIWLFFNFYFSYNDLRNSPDRPQYQGNQAGEC
jgi:hypothetical protein